MKITFKRYNDQDIECAEDNFPDLAPKSQLEAQFLYELSEFRKLGITVDEIFHPEDNIMVVHATASASTATELANQIQEILFDQGGMTGFFQVAEEYVDYQNV